MPPTASLDLLTRRTGRRWSRLRAATSTAPRRAPTAACTRSWPPRRPATPPARCAACRRWGLFLPHAPCRSHAWCGVLRCLSGAAGVSGMPGAWPQLPWSKTLKKRNFRAGAAGAGWAHAAAAARRGGDFSSLGRRPHRQDACHHHRCAADLFGVNRNIAVADALCRGGCSAVQHAAVSPVIPGWRCLQSRLFDTTLLAAEPAIRTCSQHLHSSTSDHRHRIVDVRSKQTFLLPALQGRWTRRTRRACSCSTCSSRATTPTCPPQ